MKGCHFANMRTPTMKMSHYEQEALKDDVWYGLVYSPDDETNYGAGYYWERMDGDEEGSSKLFKTSLKAKKWLMDCEQFESE